MRQIPTWIRVLTVMTGLAMSATASATVGYFALGYGAKGMGLAGAVVSNPQDSASIATNPASISAIGERWDLGIRFFSPQRKARLDTSVLNAGAAFGSPFDVEDDSRRNLFLIPNFGFNLQLRENLWFGFNNYGNGGLNSTYDRNLYDESFAVLGAVQQGGPGAAAQIPEGTSTADLEALGQLPPGTAPSDTGTLGVDLQQGIFAPTLAMKFVDKHTLGASLLIGVQRFSARGLGNFQCFTQSANPVDNPANALTCPLFAADPSKKLTNNSSDWSYGAGARVGWLGEFHPRVTLGASASSKIYMTEFDDYEDLFAEDGDLDIPANVTAGITFKATPGLKLSFDYQRIFYEGVDSISNEGPVFTPAGPAPPCANDCWTGKDKGMGFGWEDINIYRIAAEYEYNPNWTFRAGFSYNDQVIPDEEVLFNILAPATVQKHVTVGFTYNPNKKMEWNFAYMHAFREKVDSDQTAFGIPGEIEMYQNSVDLSYSYKF